MKLIDKDELLHRLEELKQNPSQSPIVLLKDIESLVESLEVKEVDLEEEMDYDDYITFFNEHPKYNNGDWGFDETWAFGQYCYKLGIKAQKL